MIAQVINFAIVLVALWYLAAKPLLKMMDARTKKVAKSLKDAEKIEADLKATEERKKAEIVKAKKEAQQIMEKANQTAEKNKQEIIAVAQSEVNDLQAKTKGEIEEAKQQMLTEVKVEVADLVVATTKKVIGKELNSAEQKELIQKTIKEAKE